jgi:hypothetical protein
MVDSKGNELKIGDRVHFFGIENMKPTGIIISR